MSGTEPTLLKGPIFENPVYAIYVGLGKDKEALPHYLVIHKEHGVVEFENDVYYLVVNWVEHFSEQMKEYTGEEVVQSELLLEDEEKITVPDNVTPFPGKKH